MTHVPEKVLTSTPQDERDVTRAWAALAGAGRDPKKIELVHRHNKSIVFRMHAIGTGGASVIAKKCRAETARIEREAYERLARLQLDALEYHGFVEDADADWGWLFIEDAAGVAYDSHDEVHRRLAARWLAALHTSSADGVTDLPDRGADDYWPHLHAARTRVRERAAALQHDAEARRTLQEALDMCDEVESIWPSLRAVSEATPRAWVHNDFSKYNVRVRTNGRAARLLAFDWEISGRGLPTIDVLVADLREYWRHVHAHWAPLNVADLERAHWVATLFRGLASMHWEATNLDPLYAKWPVRNLQLYLERMAMARRNLERACG